MQRRHLAQLTAIAIMKFSGVSFTFYMLVIGVEAQVTVDPPQNTTVTLGGIATFSCAVSDVANITFVVAGVDPSMWASRGISQSTSVSGGYTTANLTVQGNITNNGILVTCRVGYTDILPPAQLTIKEVEVDPPKNTTVPLGSNATFSCTASNVAGIDFVVAGVDHSMWASRGIIPSAPAYSGNATTTNLTVLGTIANNGLQITCRVYVTVTSHVDQLPPAQLTVEAPPSAPLNLTAAAVGGTYVVLTWSPPMDLGIGGPLYYNVSYQAVNGSHRALNITTDTNITVTSLSPGTNYSMTVLSDNGVSGNESASIYVTTNSTGTSPTPAPTAPPPAPAIAWQVWVGVGVGVGVGVVAVVLIVVVVVLIICYCCVKKKKGHTTFAIRPAVEYLHTISLHDGNDTLTMRPLEEYQHNSSVDLTQDHFCVSHTGVWLPKIPSNAAITSLPGGGGKISLALRTKDRILTLPCTTTGFQFSLDQLGPTMPSSVTRGSSFYGLDSGTALKLLLV